MINTPAARRHVDILSFYLSLSVFWFKHTYLYPGMTLTN